MSISKLLIGAAERRWVNLTPPEREVVERSLSLVLTDLQRAAFVHRLGEFTKRFEQGYRTYEIMLVTSDDCFFVLCSWEGALTVVLDLVMFNEVCPVRLH